MYEVKQSTALTLPFFAHDVSGDAVTGLTDGSFTKRISKNGAAFGAMTVTISEMENGWYSIPLSASHSDTLGLLTIVFTNAGAKQINLQFRVESKLIDDLNDVAATDIVSGGAIDTTGGAVDNVTLLATATNLTNLPTIPANWLTAAGINASALDGKGDWNIGKTGYTLTQAFPTNFSDLSVQVTTGAISLLAATQASIDAIETGTATDIPALIAALNDLAGSDVLTQVNAALDTAISELGVAAPTATPSLRTGLMLIYMALRNETVVQTSGTDALEIHNDAGTKITSKLLTDDGSDYSEAKMT